MHHNVVRCGCDGTLLHIETVLTDPAGHDGVEVWVARDERDEREAAPLKTTVGKREERDETGHDPEFAKEGMEGSLIEMITAERQRQHGDDLEHGGGDGENVGVKGRIAQTLQRQGQVGRDGGGGDVGHQPDKVESPHGFVLPRFANVLPRGGLLDGGEALGGIVAEDTVDHDDFLALGIPWLAPKDARGRRGRDGEVEEGNDGDDQGKQALDEEQPEPTRLATNAAHFQDASSQQSGNKASNV